LESHRMIKTLLLDIIYSNVSSTNFAHNHGSICNKNKKETDASAGTREQRTKPSECMTSYQLIRKIF
jgi:hypothetical protein